MTMPRAESAEFLRRPKHRGVLAIDVRAVAIAHHRYYCHRPDRATCTEVDEQDIDYAVELIEVLDHLPAWPESP